MAKHFGREDDLILLQVRPEGAGADWQPRHTYNLTSDITIPFNTFAKAVLDTTSLLGKIRRADGRRRLCRRGHP